jgi:hypothetical protein
VTISLSVIAGFFTEEVPSQQPDKSIDSKEQHTAEQDGEFSRSSAEVSYTLYPSMDNEHMNGRRHSQGNPEAHLSPPRTVVTLLFSLFIRVLPDALAIFFRRNTE